MVKNPPAKWDTWVQPPGWEDLLQEGMATHSSTLAWIISWTEDPDSPWGHKESDTTERLQFHFQCFIRKMRLLIKFLRSGVAVGINEIIHGSGISVMPGT